ncbi:MAG TPA: PilN domain-containing protein [Terriglobales bacterium]|nr:PilN domain-containing protein [Terriglobales bacterium]
MIRINLLGGPRQKRGSASVSMPDMASAAAHPALFMVAALAIGAIANGAYYLHLVNQRDRIARAMVVAETENKRLSAVKTAYEHAEKQKENYKHRVDVIEQLRQNQAGPVKLLDTIGQTVSNTDAVWLSSMNAEKDNIIKIEGLALTPTAVANLMRNLEKTGYFKSVEIQETFQDDQLKEVQAFQFTLTCEIAPQQKS